MSKIGKIKQLLGRKAPDEEEIIEDYLDEKKNVSEKKDAPREQKLSPGTESHTRKDPLSRKADRRNRREAKRRQKEWAKINDEAQKASDEADRLREEQELVEMHEQETAAEARAAEGVVAGVVAIEVLETAGNLPMTEERRVQNSLTMEKYLTKSENKHALGAHPKKGKERDIASTKAEEILPLHR